MNVFVATEGQICWLPGIELADFPEGLPSGVSFSSRSGILGVRFDGVVGSVGLNSGDVIQVHPKIGEVNFLKLVAFTNGRTSLIERMDQSSRYVLDDAQNIPELVAEDFLDCALKAKRNGLLQKYEWQQIAGREVRGRVDMILTEQRIAIAHEKPVVSKSKVRTFNTPENRLVSLALNSVENLIPDSRRHEVQSLRRRWSCPSPPATQAVVDLEIVEQSILRKQYRGVRDYYRELMELTLIVLNIAGLDHGRDQFFAGRTFLTQTATMFEAFVLRAVQTSLFGFDVVVTKGGHDFKSLYLDGTFRLEPDVVIEKSGKCVGVIDAKYKLPTSGDHYQMTSYIHNFGVSKGALFRPAYSGESSGVEKFKSVSGMQVDVLKLDLMNFNETLNDIGSYVKSLL